MALVNAGIARNVPQCRRRLSYDLNTPPSICINTSKDLDRLCTTTDHTETTASITAARISIDNEFNINLTAEPDIEEPAFNDNQVEKNTQYTSFTSDLDVPSTSAGPSKEYTTSNPIKSKVGKRKSKKDIKYIDYISDQEDFSTFYGDIDDSDNWSEGQEGITSEDDLLSMEKKVKIKRCSKKGSNVKNLSKSDANTENDLVGECATRIKKLNTRKERSKNKNSGQEYSTNKGIVVPAKTVLANPCSGKKCGNDCGSLSEERRESLFNFFGILTKHVAVIGEGRRFVCQQFLAATLNISNKTIYSIVKNASWGCAREDMRGKCEPPNKTKESTIDAVNRFIKNLPAVPSHYCRQDSSKVYLPQEYKNVTKLYKIYKQYYVDQGVDVDDPSTLCASFDLEKVLNTPYAQSMLLYYSRKLAVYNLCVYENGTRKVFCYYWDESNGKRGANEIASILHKYIQSVDARGNVTRLLLYCDCCPGQNRNRTVLAMLHSSLEDCKNIDTIQINFLLTGHTYMPVDTVHAIIENRLKNTTVYAPSQWFTVFATARQEPAPFEVQRLSYEDFYRWDSISDKYYKGNLTGKISKIRIMTFRKDKQSVKYKTSMNPSAASFDVEVQSKTKISLLPCYRSQLPISKAKYDDLVKLCVDKVIPNCFKHEFVNIPRATNVKDCLPESDIEDCDINT
ncbi:unnamed protein product [Euphydryas editha]|uniref:DUF7869 domain-containing protein n=1 Tax=Euphydryas editha TaxID=104508 RepID=A0AAU9V973_EUPED|nr:unnamed protein product [Euphydryas editha]